MISVKRTRVQVKHNVCIGISPYALDHGLSLYRTYLLLYTAQLGLLTLSTISVSISSMLQICMACPCGCFCAGNAAC